MYYNNSISDCLHIKMGSMNTNNWLSFPLSPTHSSLPIHLQSTQPHQFSLGLVNDSMENPFNTQDWNLITNQGGNEVPKVADFLGLTKSENQSDLAVFNEIQSNDSDYLYSNNSIVPLQNTMADFQESSSHLQSLTLSMGGGNKGSAACENSENSTNSIVEAPPRRTLETFGQRTSIYRGVTRHRWTGRYEAHLWDNSCRREGQSRKGRQVYLGGYDKEDKAARAYDLAALKYWGTSTTTNFPVSNYEKEVEEMKHMTRQEFVASIRRKSSGFSRGASMYRGVTRHHQHGRWQARIGRVAGNKDLYLGTFSTEEEAAEAYDIAAIKFRGLNAVTNFDMNRYDVKSILESNTLPIGGGAAKRLKEAQAFESSRKREEMIALGSSFSYGAASGSSSTRLPLQSYPLLQQSFEHSQPLISLQNQEMSHFTQDPSSVQQSYLHQLHFHHQNSGFYANPFGQSSQFFNGYVQNNHPGLLHGSGSSSSSVIMENNNYGGGIYNLGNGVPMASVSSSNGGGVRSAEELALVKVDYDMVPGGYGGWSTDHQANNGVFSMWNDG